jgi:peptide/nickel transport system substrate-binding protein
MASDAGADALKGERDIAKAKQLLKDAGYKGEKVVLIHATDIDIVTKLGLVTEGLLREMGINVDLRAMDWGTFLKRRASREPADKGGWNIFDTSFIGADLIDPAVNAPLRGNGDQAWFGWPRDDKIEALRSQWLEAPDLAAQQKIAHEIQEEAFDQVPYLSTGQFILPTAFRGNIEGIIDAPVPILWNVEKK